MGRDANQGCLQVWLLEMNSNPALHTNCEVLKEVIPGVVTETLGEAPVQPAEPSNRLLAACPAWDAPPHPPPKFRSPRPALEPPEGLRGNLTPHRKKASVPASRQASSPPGSRPSPPTPSAPAGTTSALLSPRPAPLSPPDLALETFQKSLRGQKMLPLLSQRHFVLLHDGEADLWPRPGGSRGALRPPPPLRAAPRPGARTPAPPRGPGGAHARPRPPGRGPDGGTQSREPGAERPREGAGGPAREPSPGLAEEERKSAGHRGS